MRAVKGQSAIGGLVRLLTKVQEARERGFVASLKFKDVKSAFGITRTKAVFKVITNMTVER